MIDIVAEVSLIFLLGVDERLDSVITSLHAEADTLVKDVLRLVGGIHIVLVKGLDELFIVVDCSIDDTITDSLRHDLLSLFNTLQVQLAGNISKRDLRVRDVDLLETELDDSVLQTADQREDLISSKHSLIACNQGIELVHLTLLDILDDQIVRLEVLLELFLVEDLTLRDLTHQ